MGITEFQTLWTLESSSDIIGDIAIGISIPYATKLFVVISQLFQLINLTTVDYQLKSKGIFALGIIRVFGSILILTLELYGTVNITVADNTELWRTGSLHTIFFLHLFDDIGWKIGKTAVIFCA